MYDYTAKSAMGKSGESLQLTKTQTLRAFTILVLRVALIAVLVGAGWMIYRRLPATGSRATRVESNASSLQIVLHQPFSSTQSLDVSVSFYPVDIVAVQHEYFTEPRAGKRLDDFVKERMKGRTPITTQLDKNGNGTANLTRGSWWLHAKLPGDEDLEWRLPISVNDSRQVIELTLQNAYTRSKSF
jgi:hypothetical protein